MSADEDNEDKQYEPSQKKLDDAREKGEIPKSTDLTTAAAYAGLLVACIGLGGSALVASATHMMAFLDRPAALADEVFGGGSAPVLGGITAAIALPLLPFVVLPGVLALGALFATRSLVFAGERMKPKLNKISPIAQAKNKFGRAGLFEFAKSFAKLIIYGVILGLFLLLELPEILATMALTPAMATAVLLRMSVTFLMLVLGVALVIGGIDFLWQRAEHLRKHRMSHKEMRDEHKQMEGDPHMKQQRRQKAYDIATNRMLTDVPQADVVIVNPTHYAVALKWDRARGTAPKCMAKGVDEIAARIREIAAENGVALHSDPPTARALHATVGIGEEVRPEHYRAVAAAIRFAEAMRQKARRR
jgi:flagellar biosynthetic protein FlhB